MSAPAETPAAAPTVFDYTPTTAYCNVCKQTVATEVEKIKGTFTWLLCIGILCVCPFGCCLIPFCVDRAKDAVHHCSKCKAVLGTKKVI
ncbi:hypothetical protein Ciccas_008217 [Cichlidogyrus casuarinus]|uniref:LITAF domain-containing protein n=1 Tax=Cichlidogyrus casuarinus TaxID=1844966 RepID=A0ABD2Q0L0_9PLAT